MLYIYIYKYGMIWTCRCQTALLRCQTLTGPGKHLESFGYGEGRIGQRTIDLVIFAPVIPIIFHLFGM